MMNDSLETLLRRHDPAAGNVLTPFDRTRALQTAPESLGAGRTRISIAFAMTLLLIIAGAFAFRSRRHADETGGEPRQVQMSTPGGTRIVWTLNPKFKM